MSGVVVIAYEENRKKAKEVVDEYLIVAVKMLEASIAQGLDVKPLLAQINGPGSIEILETLLHRGELSDCDKDVICAILEERHREAQLVVKQQLNLMVELIKTYIEQNTGVEAAVQNILKGANDAVKEQLLSSDLPGEVKSQLM